MTMRNRSTTTRSSRRICQSFWLRSQLLHVLVVVHVVVLLSCPCLATTTTTTTPSLKPTGEVSASTTNDNHIATRVVGGSVVEDALEFPYFAQLADESCAAAVIHDDYLISAAHCERRDHPFYKRVYLASTTLRQGIYRQIQYATGHPSYLESFQDYDFLLLKLTTSALVEEDAGTGELRPTGVKPIPYNRNASIPAAGDVLQAMGFGKTSESAGGMTNELHQVQIQYMDNDTCQDQYGTAQFVSNVMFCAGVPGGGKDTCQGDSGGPIVDTKRGVLVGLVSYGIGCARSNYAGVNSRISAVADWIDREICKGSDYPPDHCADLLGGEAGTAAAPGTTAVVKETSVTNANNITIMMTSATTTTSTTMTFQATLDDYPLEFAWSLTYLPTREEIFVQLPNTISDAGDNIEQSFDNLRPGQYDLQVGDTGNDGICCGFGNGKLRLVVNNNNNDKVVVLWENDGQYKGYLQVRLNLDSQGNVAVLFENQEYQPSWEKLQLPNYPPDVDLEWPGPFPTAPLFSFNINFRFDAYPYENNYELYYMDITDMEEPPQNNQNGDWGTSFVYQMEGIQDGIPNEIVSFEFTDQKPGWYWLHVTDLDGDGICCQFRRGWVSLTGPIITTKDYGFAWGSNGEFGKGVNVYFYINDDGFIAQVHWMLEEADAAGAAAATTTERSGNTDKNIVDKADDHHEHKQRQRQLLSMMEWSGGRN